MTKIIRGVKNELLAFLFKPKKEMAKKGTPRVRMGKYIVSSHAQNRVVDPKRDLKKTDMVWNLLGRSFQTELYDNHGEKQYSRIHKKSRTKTNISDKNVVKTIHKVHNPDKEIRRQQNEKKK